MSKIELRQRDTLQILFISLNNEMLKKNISVISTPIQVVPKAFLLMSSKKRSLFLKRR